jgi:phage/plasmid-like protein (TIGR03299 family)
MPKTSAREHALHLLGTTLPSVTTAAEALKFGRLSGWNLRKSPLTTHVGDMVLAVPGMFALLRDNPYHDGVIDVLGQVGPAYNIIQHEELERLMDTLREESGATFETAGVLDGGSRAFVTMKLPDPANIGGVDLVDTYITVVASHDGDTSTALLVTPVRRSCSSTLNLAYKNASHIYKVRHTTGAEKVLHQLTRDALDFSYKYVDTFEETAERLLSTPMPQSQFEAIISRNYGAPAGANFRTVTRAQNKLDKMAELFSDSYAIEGVGQTAWAGLVALTEWHDFHFPVRKVEGSTELEVRSRKALLEPSFKNDALKLMLHRA